MELDGEVLCETSTACANCMSDQLLYLFVAAISLPEACYMLLKVNERAILGDQENKF